MKILHVLFSRLSLPPVNYGGTERVVWSLAKAQEMEGHEVRFLWGNAKHLPQNATVYNKKKPLEAQIGDWPDIVHFHRPYDGDLSIPYINTEHGNASCTRSYNKNTVFLSQKHASNHHAGCYVYNGLDWSEYGDAELRKPSDYFHFIGKAGWPVKNLDGSVKIAREANVKLNVLGGNRLNFSKKFYFYPDRNLTFSGMVGGNKKNRLIKNSKGLIFPVRWHEPFGLAVIESLYLGVPVFSSPYGSLPEIITDSNIGLLSTNYQELADGVGNIDKYSRKLCHEHASERFNHFRMASGYMECYERVCSGETLNESKPYSNVSFHDLLPVSHL